MTAREIETRRQLALRVLVHQAGPDADAASLAAAGRRAYDELARVAAPLVGRAGVDALTGRALHLAQREYPWLADAREPEQAGGPFAQVVFALARQDPAVATEAAVAVLAIFVGLLVTLIGKPLTARLLRTAWPDALSDASADAPSDHEAQMREANECLVVGAIRAHAMAEELELANHLKDDILSTVSHELRTPVNAVLGWARMLKSKQLPRDRARHAIDSVERNASALAHIIDDLLDVSRIMSGTLHLTVQPVDLIAVAQAALDAVRPLALVKEVQLAFSPDRRSIERLNGDGDRLQQVIWNLLANAVKFTPQGGRVAVLIERANDHIEVRVVDTGQGISPDFLPHVFERFRQADGATTRRHTGLGLGLAIVRQLVELHGGTVHAVSELGRGSTFTIRLPVSDGEAREGQAVPLEEHWTASSKSTPLLQRLDDLRVLVVDDSADGRTLTVLLLTQAGASVTAVASAREALQALEVTRPDVLVSDIGLPDEDGYALIRQIRQHEAEHGGFLPAVALTGYARAEDRVRCLAAGFQAHVRKPVEPVELTSAIATITRRAMP
jgi:signal transduction histidine kinase/ActR/RegA family two-component response regulator